MEALKAASQGKKTALTKRGSKLSNSTVEEYHFPIAANCSLDLHFRLLRNVEGGRYLIPDDNCNIEVEKLDEMDDEHKASQYWFSYIDHHGEEVTSEKKSYIKDF